MQTQSLYSRGLRLITASKSRSLLLRWRATIRSMQSKALILDAGGVLLSEPVPDTLQYATEGNGLSAEDCFAIYKENLYHDLWAGDLPAEEFWKKLAEDLEATRGPEEIEGFFLENLVLLPEAQRVPEWAKQSDLALLSNHLSAWLLPLLEKADILKHFSQVWVSEETGKVKPQKEAFEQTEEWREQYQSHLFVDDIRDNYIAAESSGMNALLAEAGWSTEVDAWLT